MSMEELWAAVASDVAEELKTLTEVILVKPSQGKDPIGDVREPDTGGLKQKTDKSGRPRPKPCGGKDPHDGGKRPIGGGEVPSTPIYTCGGPRWEDFEWPEGVKKPTQWPKEPTDAEIIKAGIDFIMDTDFGGE